VERRDFVDLEMELDNCDLKSNKRKHEKSANYCNPAADDSVQETKKRKKKNKPDRSLK